MKKFEHSRIRTHRLDLVAATLEHLLAELESPDQLAALLRTNVEPGWPPGDYDRDAQEFFRARLETGGMSLVGWYGWYAVRRADLSSGSVLIGAGGYMGPPDERGEVEIGFSVMPGWRNMGYACEMTAALISNAFGDVRVRRVVARSRCDNNASIRVLTNAGLCFVRRDRLANVDFFQITRR